MLSSDGQKREGLRILGFPVRFSTTHSIDRSADFAPGKSHWILLHATLIPHHTLMPQNRTFPFDALNRRPKLSFECVYYSFCVQVSLSLFLCTCACVCMCKKGPCTNREIRFLLILTTLDLLSELHPTNRGSADCRRCICSESIRKGNNVAHTARLKCWRTDRYFYALAGFWYSQTICLKVHSKKIRGARFFQVLWHGSRKSQ